MGMSYFGGKMGVYDPLGFHIVVIEGSDVQKNAFVFIPQ
jgi:hypothetical protein